MKYGILFFYYIICLTIIGYVGVYWGLIEPIMNIAEMVDANLVTATGVAWEICKILLRELATGIVGIILFTLGTFLTRKILY